jgi:O-succinylhomoserine sulfhydrylase
MRPVLTLLTFFFTFHGFLHDFASRLVSGHKIRSDTVTKDRKWRSQTQLVHGGQTRSQFGETSEALFLTSGYVYECAEQAEARFKEEEDGYIYSRFGNPTVRMFEERMIALEGADDARATATGMAAVTATMLSQLKAGDHIVSARALFGSCRFIVETLLPRYGITSTLIDGNDLAAWQQAIQPNTKLFFLETPSNPVLEVIDIAAVAEIAKANNIRLVVDNVFATPILQKPLDLGADIVVYSATKHIDGQGRCMGGIILGRQDFIKDELSNFLRQTGPALSPFNAWVMLKSLETLNARVDAHCNNAEVLADALAVHPRVERVYYPWRSDHPQHAIAKKQMARGGNLIALDIKGGKSDAFAVLNALHIARISNNLGDTKTLATHPATTTHQRLSPEVQLELGIKPGSLRLSVGLEDPQDLIDDFTQALDVRG